jgi:hypothetical protein
MVKQDQNFRKISEILGMEVPDSAIFTLPKGEDGKPIKLSKEEKQNAIIAKDEAKKAKERHT